MRWVLVSVCIICGSSALADTQQFLSADGGVFSFEANQHGAVLTAIDPSAAPIVVGQASSPTLRPGQILYLGRSCDAFNRVLGEGTWKTIDGSFVAKFKDAQLAFPGQRIELSAADRCSG